MIPMTLSLYIGRRFLLGILAALLGLLVVASLLDFVELIRRASGHEHVPINIVAQMALLRMPMLAEKLQPFAVLIGGMLTLAQLTRTHELVVARAAGVSVWQFLMPALLIALVFGIAAMTIFNPLSAAMALKYEQIEGKYLRGWPSLLTVSSSGLWLRQIEGNNPEASEYIIHAARVSQKDMTLSDVTIFAFGKEYAFLDRLDATTAQLKNGFWELSNVTRSAPGQPPELLPLYRLKTDKTITEIEDSFASPETLSFWELPSFIGTLQKAGFSALGHRLHWHTMLATPLLLCAMILVAATFSLRLPRRGGTALLIVAGVLTGFIVRFMTDLVGAFGLSGALPLPMAAWMPVGICLLIGTALLLHLEDG